MVKRRLPIVVGEDSGDIPIDMPTFAQDAKKCRYCYFVGASRPEGWFPFRSIVKFDFETEEACNWDAGDHQVTSEAMYIPRSEKEDDGFVVSIVHNSDTKTCRLVVWDSPTFESGPIASVALGDLVPWCVHGSWYPEYNP